MDSLIRLNQINLSELSGYIASIFDSLPKQNISGNLTPSESGVYSLGSSSNYYKNIYVNGVSIPSGSGIKIGNSFLTAYTSNGAGIIKIDDYEITSSGDFISIQGPQGIQGPIGATGKIGPTGIGITGVSYNQNNYILTFQLSNGVQTGVKIPPLSGASGISVVGFYQTGNLIYPKFSNKRTGDPIELPSGARGPQGLPGTAILYLNSGSGNYQGKISNLEFPKYVQISDYYTINPFPPISLMRGMSYTFNFSGLNTHVITQEDQSFIEYIFNNPNIPSKVGQNSNYYIDPSNGTGYWRIAFFDSDAKTGIYSGLYDGQTGFYNKLSGRNEEVYGNNFYYDVYRNTVTFNTKYSAKSQYKYGFVVYSIGEEEDEVLTERTNLGSKSIAIIVGDALIGSGVGPPGPQGPQGQVGPPGTGVGPKGDPGANIIGVSQRPNQSNPNTSEIRFEFEDNTSSNWIILPQGGPAGPSGKNGPPGSLTNYFSGEYSEIYTYKQNDTVSRNGSTYIYINSTPNSNKTPEDYIGSFWQLLAKSGDKGEKGDRGLSGIADKYSSSFSVKLGYPTGLNNFFDNSTGITVNGINLSGTGAIFKTGDNVSFRNSGIIGYSYTPYQNIIFSSNSVVNSYFFGKVNSYDSQSGIINFFVESGGTGIINNTISGKYFLWYNYNNATLNLGANLMSGSPGPRGEIGPQGPPGQPSALRNSGVLYLNYNQGSENILPTSGFDAFNITITGLSTNGGVDGTYIDFDWNYFETGKCVLVRIRNSGVNNGNLERPLFYFGKPNVDEIIKWPNGIYTRPNNGEVYIYSILRFADENGKTACFGTYSNPYYY